MIYKGRRKHHYPYCDCCLEYQENIVWCNVKQSAVDIFTRKPCKYYNQDPNKKDLFKYLSGN